MTQARYQLKQLAQAYFNQDYDLDAPTPADVVRSFRQGESPGAVADLMADIQSILDSSLSEDEISNLWIRECGASYDPWMEGKSYRSWFAEVLRELGAS